MAHGRFTVSTSVRHRLPAEDLAFSFQILAERLTLLCGESGSGKSSLLRKLADQNGALIAFLREGESRVGDVQFGDQREALRRSLTATISPCVPTLYVDLASEWPAVRSRESRGSLASALGLDVALYTLWKSCPLTCTLCGGQVQRSDDATFAAEIVRRFCGDEVRVAALFDVLTESECDRLLALGHDQLTLTDHRLNARYFVVDVLTVTPEDLPTLSRAISYARSLHAKCVAIIPVAPAGSDPPVVLNSEGGVCEQCCQIYEAPTPDDFRWVRKTEAELFGWLNQLRLASPFSQGQPWHDLSRATIEDLGCLVRRDIRKNDSPNWPLLLLIDELARLDLGAVPILMPVGHLSQSFLKRSRIAQLISREWSGIILALDNSVSGLTVNEGVMVVKRLAEFCAAGNTAIAGVAEQIKTVDDPAIDLVRLPTMPINPVQLSENLQSQSNATVAFTVSGEQGSWLNKRSDSTLQIEIPGLTGILVPATLPPAELLQAIASQWEKVAQAHPAAPGRAVIHLAAALHPSKHRTVNALLELADPLAELYCRLPNALTAGLRPEDFRITGATVRTRKRESCICSECLGLGTKGSGGSYSECTPCKGVGLLEPAASTRFSGVTLPELLRLPIAQAVEVLHGILPVRRPLQLAIELGLGGLALIQLSDTLSHGEGNRVQLVAACGRRGAPALLLLEDPTVFLSPDQRLNCLSVLSKLCATKGLAIVIAAIDERVVAGCERRIDFEGEPSTGNPP